MGLTWWPSSGGAGLNFRAVECLAATATASLFGRDCIPRRLPTFGKLISHSRAVANGRNSRRNGDSGRDAGGFVALPWSVLDCPAYARLSHPARGLLFEFARQFVRDNNGRLLASAAYLGKRGWKSADVITRAKRELLEAGFIFQTVQGQRPNKASWYAVTWRTLDRIPGYDAGVEKSFERGAYQKNVQLKNALLIPSHGVDRLAIAPPHGVERGPPTPSHGAIRPTFDHLSTPSHGNHLDMPSVCAMLTPN